MSKFTITGFKQIIENWEAISAKEITNAIVEEYKQNIENSGNIDGSQMRGLTKQTLAYKSRKGYPSTPLIATGQLIQAGRSVGGKNKAKAYITPSRRGKVDNTDILTFQSRQHREPFGISFKLLEKLRARYKLFAN